MLVVAHILKNIDLFKIHVLKIMQDTLIFVLSEF